MNFGVWLRMYSDIIMHITCSGLLSTLQFGGVHEHAATYCNIRIMQHNWYFHFQWTCHKFAYETKFQGGLLVK